MIILNTYKPERETNPEVIITDIVSKVVYTYNTEIRQFNVHTE